ncbi:UDP-N-acetylmuramate--L-alanine ligase [Candidatus Margulisiibacteriota bacterium]
MGTIKKSHLVHFIGIGGCGMSAIAKIMFAHGYQISGSDIKETVNTIRLRDKGIKVNIGHDREYIRNADIIVVTAAIRDDNDELCAAREKKIPVMKRAEVLAWLMDRHEIKIAVGGTHGKTTTTGMLATLLEHQKYHPTFSVGGDVNEFNTNAKAGDGRYFATEADESDGSILFLSPTIFILTNIEEDHLEYLGNLENIENLFWKVIDKLPENGLLIINYDNSSCKQIAARVRTEKPGLKVLTYGQGEDADYHISVIEFDRYSSRAKIFHGRKPLGELELNVPGVHNLENACAIVALAEEIGLSFHQVQASLKSFMGTKRRFQLIGEARGVTIIDDYAHHPSEIKATLAAAKNGFKSRIICVFQPHRYTRTMFFSEEFSKAFSDADVAIITDVYSAGESPIQGVSGHSIFGEMNNGTKSVYVPKKEAISTKALELLQDGDIFLTMGAGDIHTVAKETLMRLRNRKT